MTKRKLISTLASMLLVLVAFFVVVIHEEGIDRANADRCINRSLATEAYTEIVANYDLNIRTYEFALKGLKAKGAEEGMIKAIEQLLFETYEARAFLEKDYKQFMEANEPLRSWIPPFKKECP